MTPRPTYTGLPLPEPAPVHDCAECQALARQREAARRQRDHTTVVDCNVKIRRHPHGPPDED
ncbi:hypothetical protein [Streptomyces paradoxus]|uniref:hypothetical protein n=1 Tax=Streptomyces paradoxus TaxID=66375 RepID=UPI0038254E7E